MHVSRSIPTQNESSYSNVCSCANSIDTLKATKKTTSDVSACPFSNPCIDECPSKFRGQSHEVKRKKYKQGDLSSICLQCNYEICDQETGNARGSTRAMEVQCELEPGEDSELETICSVCKCSSGFCNQKCESNKTKIGPHRSDSWRCPKDNTSTQKKNNSEPGLGQGLVVNPNSACKCVSKCIRECEDMKMASAMAKRTSKTVKDSTPCKQYNCESKCSKSNQTDEDEPIAPLAPVPMESTGPPALPLTTEKSAICVACQCTGVCSVPCTLEKQGIRNLITPGELSEPDICAVCECVAECHPRCASANLSKDSNKVCEDCTCTGECIEKCREKKENPKKNKSPIICQKEYEPESNKVKADQDKPNQDKADQHKPDESVQTAPLPNTANVGIVCNMCSCSDVCNEACELVKTESGAETKPVCEKCTCLSECNETCETIKMEARRICDECVCNATCLPKCAEKKRQKEKGPPKICDICNCCGQCIKECDLNKAKIATEGRPSILVVKETRASAEACKETRLPDEAVKETRSPDEAVKETRSPDEADKETRSPDETGKEDAVSTISNKEGHSSSASVKEGRVSRVSIDPAAISDSKSKVTEIELDSEVTEPSTATEENTSDEPDPEATTQVKGIIENFDDKNITNKLPEASILPEDKSRSSCNVAGEVVCENCECTGECNVKCAAIRKIRSVAEFPPADTVCNPCTCLDKCTKLCERNKRGMICVTASGQPIKCDDENKDWIPCVSCEDGKPCSPECRERKAIAAVMPQPPSAKVISCAENQCSEPNKGLASTKPVQTCSPPGTCRKVQTNEDSDEHPIARTTSTQNGNIQKKDGEPASEVPPRAAQQPCPKLPPCIQQLIMQGEISQARCSCMDLQHPPTAPATSNKEESPSKEPPPSDGQHQSCERECGMCQKLRGYINSVFNKDTENGGCKCADGTNVSNEKTKRLHQICECINMIQSQEHSSPDSSQPPIQNESAPCTCKTLQHRKSSYTDKMQNMMGQLRAKCEDAETAASPFIKAASAFDLSVNNQQEAIISLLQKCKQKDNYIDALIDELLGRSKSMIFDDLLTRLQEPSTNAPDFDRILICNALDKSCKRGTVCGIDLQYFRIINVSRVGATSLLVKWTPPADNRVCGYEIMVNGQLKTKVSTKERMYAILDALDFSSTIAIENFAITKGGKAYPSAVAYYAKY